MSPSVPGILRALARLGLRIRRPVADVVDLRTPDARAVWLGFDQSWSWMASPTMPTTRPLWLPRSRWRSASAWERPSWGRSPDEGRKALARMVGWSGVRPPEPPRRRR